MRHRGAGREGRGGGFARAEEAKDGAQASDPSHSMGPGCSDSGLPSRQLGGAGRVFLEPLGPCAPPRALESREVILVWWEVKGLPLPGALGARDKAQATVWSPWGYWTDSSRQRGALWGGVRRTEGSREDLQDLLSQLPHSPARPTGLWGRLPTRRPSWEPGTSLPLPLQLRALPSAGTQTFKVGLLRKFKGDAFGGSSPNNPLLKS